MVMKKLFLLLFACSAAAESWALPYIPGCPLHESCVRALKQEQRARQRQLRQKESPEMSGDEDAPLGLVFGFQFDGGDFGDKTGDYLSLRPSLGYITSIAGFDLFAFGFYTLSLDDPGLSPVHKTEALSTMHRGGVELSLGYTFDLNDILSLGLSLDSQNQFNFTPDTSLEGQLAGRDSFLSFSLLEPALDAALSLDSGSLRLTNSFPFGYADSKSLDYKLTLSFDWAAGFGAAASAEWWNLWEEETEALQGFEFGGVELTLSYWRGAFFASLTAGADGAFTSFDIEPYCAYSFGKLTLFASVVMNNLGEGKSAEETRLDAIQGKRDVTSVIPSIGVKIRI